MARLFNAYVMVDWSAASGEKPNLGPNSIWIGVQKRDSRFRPTFEAHNPPSRQTAEAILRNVLADLQRKGDRALVGFDFPLGYPEGTAAALKFQGEPWAAMWKFLGSGIVDPPGKMNNRATIAARMNRLMTDGPRPFWGAPRAADATTHLSKTKPSDHNGALPEFRRAESLTRARMKAQGAKSVWQLTGNGSVGSQALVGIPAVKRLRDELGEKAVVWPFETGWKALTEQDLAGKDAVLAEIYPATIPVTPVQGETLDAAQVRSLCEHFSRLDADGKLASAFGPGKDATEADIAAVQAEEGWILGV